MMTELGGAAISLVRRETCTCRTLQCLNGVRARHLARFAPAVEHTKGVRSLQPRRAKLFYFASTGKFWAMETQTSPPTNGIRRHRRLGVACAIAILVVLVLAGVAWSEKDTLLGE